MYFGSVIPWSCCSDVMTAILNAWHHCRKPTPSVDGYSLEEQSCQILSRSDMNWGALCLVSSVPLPFCRCRCARERNCWKRLPLTAFEVTRTLIGCPPYGRTAKIGFDLMCYGTAVTAQRQVGTGTAQRNFFYVDNVILTALTEFLRNLCNGNGRTATERWKLGIGFYEEHRPKNRTTWAAIGDQFLVVTF